MSNDLDSNGLTTDHAPSGSNSLRQRAREALDLARRPSATPRRSWRPCGSRSWSSTRASGSRRPTPPSTGRSTFRRPRPSAASSTNSAKASGTSPACGRCWRRRSPRRSPSTTSRSSTTSRRSARGACCSTPAASRPEGEHPTLVLLAIEDVTERKRADAALRDSELRFRRLFQTAKDGILILDADDRDDHRGQPVHVRPAGLRTRRLPGQGTLGDRPVPGQGGEPGRLPGTAGERATSATSTCR